jgi:lipopolysaccharide export system protein LptA
MSKVKSTLLSFALLVAFASSATRGQSPQPIVVQAASPASTSATSTAAVPVVQESATIQASIKTLEQIKAANQEILSKQKAALERLDEIQQSAEQIKVLAKRG